MKTFLDSDGDQPTQSGKERTSNPRHPGAGLRLDYKQNAHKLGGTGLLHNDNMKHLYSVILRTERFTGDKDKKKTKQTRFPDLYWQYTH